MADTVRIKQCNSATCEGNEHGCGRGDCITSRHFKRTSKWKTISLEDFKYIYDREPHAATKRVDKRR